MCFEIVVHFDASQELATNNLCLTSDLVKDGVAGVVMDLYYITLWLINAYKIGVSLD